MSFNSRALATKLIHVFAGIYIWEWVTTVHFEWEVITGQRRFRWSFIAYELCRTLTLGSISTMLVGLNLHHHINCDVWLRTLLVFSWIGITFSSLLILLRGVAIWGRNLTVLIITAGVWLCNFGFSIYAIMRGSTVWVPALNDCVISHTSQFRWGITANFITDMVLLSVMFAGVLSKRNATGLWRVLYIQGLTWFLVATLSVLPPAILGWMNIDDGWNLMFSTPHLVILVIMATRVYRDLFEYINPTIHDTRMPSPPRMIDKPTGQVQVTIHKTVDIDIHTSISEVDLNRGKLEAKEMQFEV